MLSGFGLFRSCFLAFIREGQLEKRGTSERRALGTGKSTLRTIALEVGHEWYEATIKPNGEKYEHIWSCLKANGDGKQYVSDDRYYSRKGLDASSHQGDIEWQAVKEDGYEFTLVGYKLHMFSKYATIVSYITCNARTWRVDYYVLQGV
jgi:hypothetical protein